MMVIRCLTLCILLFSGLSVLGSETQPWEAQWIWRTDGGDDYNEWMLARKTVTVTGKVRQARLWVTADTLYRAYVNGCFASDGPARAFPQHYRYDTLDVSRLLKPGENTVAIRVHHWGRDTAKNIAVQPGLLAQLEWADEAGNHVRGTDQSWRVSNNDGHDASSPQVSAHLGFEEQYDARKTTVGWRLPGFDDRAWANAKEVAPAMEGPWLDLQPKGIPQLTRTPVSPISVMDIRRVRPPRIVSTLNVGRCKGIARKANSRNWHRMILVTTIRSETRQTATVFRPSAAFEFGLYRFPRETVNVKDDLLQQEEVPVTLEPGANPLVVVLEGPSEVEEFQFSLDAEAPISLSNPFGKGAWAMAGPYGPKDQRWLAMKEVPNFEALQPHKKHFRDLEPREMIGTDVHGLTCFRCDSGSGHIGNPRAMLQDNEEVTVIPAGEEDLELMIDLGREINAHVGLELDSPAGVVIDGNIFERFHEGRPQWSWRNRSTFRYVTRSGWQDYVTMRHFGGRYLALTIRARPADIRIRRIFGLFAHYPVTDRGRFHCDDDRLNQVWTISRNTMLACMEDTFVDCPLYEQSYWLGDARNEALVCYRMFGDADLVRRCCILGAESLEHGDLAAMRVPTRWGRVIPAWSFLWLRMCWENYEYTGDRETLLRTYYPAVRRMLDTCVDKYLDPDTGLFAIRAWQFFDWIGLDNGHKRVTHNNTFLVDSLRIGAHMADVTQDAETAKRYRALANTLVDNINKHLWDNTRGAYIDSIHDDGSKSASVSRQINTLALLHGVVPEVRREQVERVAFTEGEEDVVQFGSPFATLYLLELLGESGRIEEMLNVIRNEWGGMLDEQTTTFWESFDVGNLGGKRYPTRSYCHAWSSGAAYAFSRYVLGVQSLGPGGKTLNVQPAVGVLPRAYGIVPIPEGRLEMSWTTDETGSVTVSLESHGNVEVRFQPPRGWRVTDQSNRQHTFTLRRETGS